MSKKNIKKKTDINKMDGNMLVHENTKVIIENNDIETSTISEEEINIDLNNLF